MILILEDDADREAYRTTRTMFSEELITNHAARLGMSTVWISPEAYRLEAVLADLRAKVEALPSEWVNGRDCYWAEDILDLIDEASA
jgi:hypothetical protein